MTRDEASVLRPGDLVILTHNDSAPVPMVVRSVPRGLPPVLSDGRYHEPRHIRLPTAPDLLALEWPTLE